MNTTRQTGIPATTRIFGLLACLGLPLGSLADSSIIGYGNYVAAGGDTVAYLALESTVGADLNGDGDRSDSVLQIHNTASGQHTNTGIAAYNFRIDTDGETVAYLQHEQFIRTDANGDGDQRDVVLAWYDIASGVAVNSAAEPSINTGQFGKLHSFSVDGPHIVFMSRESGWQDYNGDGDTNDHVLRYLDRSSGQVISTPLTSTFGMVRDGVIATRAYENSSLDFNGDGDHEDSVLLTYELATGQHRAIFDTVSINLSSPSAFPALSDDGFYFKVSERQLDVDLDGDGNVGYSTAIVRHDLVTGSTVSTGVLNIDGNTGIQVAGDVMVYQVYESRIEQDINQDGDYFSDSAVALHNLATGEVSYAVAGSHYGLSYSTLAYSQWEGRIGIDTDVNTDGDTSDRFVLAVPTGQQASCVDDDIACRIAEVIGFVSSHAEISAAAGQSLIGFLEMAIAHHTGQFSNPIDRHSATIGALDDFFNVLWPLSEADISRSAQGELEQRVRPIKDAVHDLRDAAADAMVEENSGQGNGGGIESLLGSLYATIQAAQPGLDPQIGANLAHPMTQIFEIAQHFSQGLISEQDAIAGLVDRLNFLSGLAGIYVQLGFIPQSLADELNEGISITLAALPA